MTFKILDDGKEHTEARSGGCTACPTGFPKRHLHACEHGWVHGERTETTSQGRPVSKIVERCETCGLL